MDSNTRAEAGDAVSAELTAILARLGELADVPVDDPPVSGAVRIARIAVLEQMRAALAAAQQTEMVAFGRAQVEEQVELVAAGQPRSREAGSRDRRPDRPRGPRVPVAGIAATQHREHLGHRPAADPQADGERADQ